MNIAHNYVSILVYFILLSFYCSHLNYGWHAILSNAYYIMIYLSIDYSMGSQKWILPTIMIAYFLYHFFSYLWLSWCFIILYIWALYEWVCYLYICIFKWVGIESILLTIMLAFFYNIIRLKCVHSSVKSTIQCWILCISILFIYV